MIDVETGEVLLSVRHNDRKSTNLSKMEGTNSLAAELVGSTWKIAYDGGSTYINLRVSGDGTWNATDLRMQKLNINGGQISGSWRVVDKNVVLSDYGGDRDQIPSTHTLSLKGNTIFAICRNPSGRIGNQGPLSRMTK